MRKPRGPDEQPIDKTYNLFTGGVIDSAPIHGFDGNVTLLFSADGKRLAHIDLDLTPVKDLSDEDKST
jgi:hypothetical protein